MSPVELSRPARTRLLAALLLLLVFAAGVAAGVAGDRFYLIRERRVLPTTGLDLVSNRIVATLERELDLTAGQREQIESILERRKSRIESIWAEMRPKVRGEVEATNAEIERLLSPEQRKKFERLRARWKERSLRVFG